MADFLGFVLILGAVIGSWAAVAVGWQWELRNGYDVGMAFRLAVCGLGSLIGTSLAAVIVIAVCLMQGL